MHLDIIFGLQVVESSSLVSVLFREAFNHPYISFFHLLVYGVSVIYIYVCGPKTLVINSPFQTFEVGLLIEFID